MWESIFSWMVWIGGIAPGKYADMVIIPDPGIIKAEYVISKGKIIAREGSLLVSPRKRTFFRQILTSSHNWVEKTVYIGYKYQSLPFTGAP